MLDNHATYKKYDKEDILYGIDHLPEQLQIAWHDTRELHLPNFSGVSSIVVAGMGGSALGPHMMQAVFSTRLKVPFEIVRGYTLPAHVSSKTLVVLSSFSGTTEETLAVAEEAKKRRAKMLAICAGGPLEAWAHKNKVPVYVFEPGVLAKQPRMGVGFSFMGIAGMLERAKLLKITAAEAESMVRAMGEVIDTATIDVPEDQNPAKAVARALIGKQVIIVGAEHLVGNIHALTNQINETAKHFAVSFELPELNHHLLEGFTHPRKHMTQTVALLIQSELYHPRIQKRAKITADLMESQGLAVVEYQTGGETPLEEIAEVLQFGSYVSYYLAMLNRVEGPEKIPFVDTFKKRMAE